MAHERGVRFFVSRCRGHVGTYASTRRNRFYLAGRDLEGRPLLVMKLSQIFPHKISSVDQIVAFIKYYVDELLADCQRRGVVNEISAIGA